MEKPLPGLRLDEEQQNQQYNDFDVNYGFSACFCRSYAIMEQDNRWRIVLQFDALLIIHEIYKNDTVMKGHGFGLWKFREKVKQYDKETLEIFGRKISCTFLASKRKTPQDNAPAECVYQVESA